MSSPASPDAHSDPRGDARTDAELVHAAAAGERTAFDELYRRHRRFVLAVARRTAGSDADAHDALQETFLYLVRKLATLELSGRLSSLLYPVAQRFARAARERSRRVRTDEDALELASRHSSSDAGSGSGSSDAGAREDLVALVRGLPAELRETLILRYADGLELAAVAEALGLPVGTVKSRLHQALKLLQADPRAKRWLG